MIPRVKSDRQKSFDELSDLIDLLEEDEMIKQSELFAKAKKLIASFSEYIVCCTLYPVYSTLEILLAIAFGNNSGRFIPKKRLLFRFPIPLSLLCFVIS